MPDSFTKTADILRLVRAYGEVQGRDHGGYHIFTVEGHRSSLRFFGSHHINDSAHPMLNEIRRHFDEWQPQTVFVEAIRALRRVEVPASTAALGVGSNGAPESAACGEAIQARLAAHAAGQADAKRALLESPLEEVVKRWGESGFAARVALERGISVECPEPSGIEEIRGACAEGLSRDAIFAYFAFRNFSFAPKGASIEDLGRGLSPFISEIQEATGWGDFDFSFSNLLAIGQRVWGEDPARPGDYAFFRMRTAPFGSRAAGNGTEINEVSAAAGIFRDRHILLRLLAARERSKRMLVVYGSGHAFTLEEALRAGFSSPE